MATTIGTQAFVSLTAILTLAACQGAPKRAPIPPPLPAEGGTGEVERDGEDPKLMSVAVTGSMAAGTYTVAWRGIGDDGHVIRDDFQFSVAEQN